jgi:uncharacterized protein YxeA
MKKILSILTVSILLISGSVYASFPVKQTQASENNTEVTSDLEEIQKTELTKSEVKKALKKANKENQSSGMDTELIITLVLWFFLGAFAAHRWYRGKPTGWNILFILTAGGCGIWAIVDLVNILRGNF